MHESAAVLALRRLGVFVTSAELQEMAKNVGGVHDQTNEVKMSAEQFMAMLEELLAAVLEVCAYTAPLVSHVKHVRSLRVLRCF